ncbi:MAG: hypothetical protein ACLFPQ_00830 [Candidatus Woesearchaeota archaeon]
MGGRKSYSSNKITGRGLGKYKKKIGEAIDGQKTLDIAINTTKAAIDNKKQKQEFSDALNILKKIVSSPQDRDEIKKTDSFSKLLSKFDPEAKPLTKDEKKYLSFAKSKKWRHTK